MQDMDKKLIAYINTFELLMTDDLRSSFRLMLNNLDVSSAEYIIDTFSHVVRMEQLRFFKQGLLKGFNVAYFFSSMEDMEQDNNDLNIKAFENVVSFMDYKKNKSAGRKTRRKKQAGNVKK